jgi:hypothetical protein
MGSFQQPRAHARKDGLYVLDVAYVYETDLISPVGWWAVNIPAGFVWDGASVPRLLWTLSGIRPGGRMVGPSLVHDYLYRRRRPTNCDYTRKDADQLFRYLMLKAGLSKMKARRAYWAVRLFGRSSWKRK